MDNKFDNIIDEIANASLRSSVITATSVIESMLEKLILEYLIDDTKNLKLFSGNGCLSTLSSKNNLAYAMGLISKELYKDIDSYRNIRNKCAHELMLDDEVEQSIKDRTRDFKLMNSVFKVGKDEQLKTYMVLEFAVILIALIKRINNVEKLAEYSFEVHDDYLVFTDEDYEIINKFSTYFK